MREDVRVDAMADGVCPPDFVRIAHATKLHLCQNSTGKPRPSTSPPRKEIKEEQLQICHTGESAHRRQKPYQFVSAPLVQKMYNR